MGSQKKHSQLGQAFIKIPAQSAQWTKMAVILNISFKLVLFRYFVFVICVFSILLNKFFCHVIYYFHCICRLVVQIMVYTIRFYSIRCCSRDKLKFVADEWRRYKGVHRYTYKQTKQQTNLCIIFFQTFFISNFLKILMNFLTIYKLPDLLFKFLTFSNFPNL